MKNTAERTDLASADWPDRCAFWRAESEPTSTRRRREREQEPLILTGHGLSLRVDKGCLLVRDGNTYYPADRRESRFFKGTLGIPPAFIILDGSGEITLGAMDWLATQDLTRTVEDGGIDLVVSYGRCSLDRSLFGFGVASRLRT